jgi:hypothetical protein
LNNPVFITRSSSTVQGVRKTTHSYRLQIGEMSLAMILVVMLAIISLLYLIHINQSATNGYIIKSLEVEYEEYSTVSEVWNMRNAEARSMNKILESNVIKNMVKPTEISYLNE